MVSRDRLVVRTLRCGRSNPGSNPGPGMFFLVLLTFFVYFSYEQRSLTTRQNETRGERPLPASDELFDEAADQISGRNLPVFKTAFV